MKEELEAYRILRTGNAVQYLPCTKEHPAGIGLKRKSIQTGTGDAASAEKSTFIESCTACLPESSQKDFTSTTSVVTDGVPTHSTLKQSRQKSTSSGERASLHSTLGRPPVNGGTPSAKKTHATPKTDEGSAERVRTPGSALISEPSEQPKSRGLYVRVGDTVKCKPISGCRFKATVLRITEDTETGLLEIDVVRQGDHRQLRTFTPASISRVAQSRVEVRA